MGEMIITSKTQERLRELAFKSKERMANLPLCEKEHYKASYRFVLVCEREEGIKGTQFGERIPMETNKTGNK